jgi:hypothetical protein
MAVVVSVSGIMSYVYSRPATFDCYWRYEDCDFCYVVGALRLLDGDRRSGFIEHPGYSLMQVLGWEYAVLTEVGFLKEASFAKLTANPDPLGYLKKYVVAGWGLGALVYVATTVLAFLFSRTLSGSQIGGLLGATLAAWSLAAWQFIDKIRPEAMSALLGVSALFAVTQCVRVRSYLLFLFYGLVGATLLSLSVITKINAAVLLLVVPAALLLADETALDRAANGALRWTLVVLGMVNLLWIVPLILTILLKYQVLGLSAIIWKAVAVSVLGIFPFLVNMLRLYLLGRKSSVELRWISVFRKSAAWSLMFLTGWLGAVVIGLIHPRLSSRSLSEGIGPDLVRSLVLIISPDTNVMYVTDGGSFLTAAAGVGKSLAGYYSVGLVAEVGLLGLLVWLSWRRSSKAGMVGFLLVTSMAMAAFSSLRGMLDRYAVYEELPRILAVATSVGIWRDVVEVQGGVARLAKLVFGVLMGIVLVVTIGDSVKGMMSIKDGKGCPSWVEVAKGGGCVCNEYYAGNTGMKEMIESHYGDKCAEAVAKWADARKVR